MRSVPVLSQAVHLIKLDLALLVLYAYVMISHFDWKKCRWMEQNPKSDEQMFSCPRYGII